MTLPIDMFLKRTRLLASMLLPVCILGLIPPLLCAEEKVDLRFDGRKWKLISQATQLSQRVAEYMLENETADKWTESVAAQVMSVRDKKASLEEWTKQQEARLRNICTGTITWNIISRGDTDLMCEWKLEKDHLRPDEQRIVRLIRGADGIHVLRYVTRKVPMTEARRTQWIELLKAAKLVGTK